MAPKHPQDLAQEASLRDPEAFWSHQAAQVSWSKPPTSVFTQHAKRLPSGASHPEWQWFPGGQINTCYNCVDRHVEAGFGEYTAIIWDSPVTGSKVGFSYSKVKEEVEALAAVLRDEGGVKKGDTVVIYMPMIPQALFSCLAASRLGAIHAVVFGGFSASSLAQRIDSAAPKVILTASCGIEGGKGPQSYEPMITGAVKASKLKPEKVFVYQRDALKWDLNRASSSGAKVFDWESSVRKAKELDRTVDPVPVDSDDPVYIIYTSGTTGAPKGVVRSTAGHIVGLNFTIKYIFGIRQPGDVMFTASDIGWVVGHSYILYAPLLAGAATVLFEGKPIGTPDAGTFWRIVREHNVNSMFTAPTALRAMRREDPEFKLFKEAGSDGGLRSLQALFLAGERSEPSLVSSYQTLLSQFCAPDAQVIDNWWSSESGSPITALALTAAAGTDFQTHRVDRALRMKPGSAGKPCPGFDVRIVDDDGKEVPQGELGNIVMLPPLAPTGFNKLWKDPERFYRSYLQRFNGKFVDTGDVGIKDADGYVSILSRADDVINVAAHRLSTGAIEQAITSHPDVAEACIVGVPDDLKGSLPFAFVTLSTAEHPTSAVPASELFDQVQKLVREQIGPIASLGGMIQGKGMIPKTRSGKTLRRVLKELLENAVHREYAKEVGYPATIEDAGVIQVSRAKIKEYFESEKGGRHAAIEARAKL